MRSLLAILLLTLPSPLLAADPDLANDLAKLNANVIIRGTVRENPLANMLANDARAGLRLANQRESEAWSKVKSATDAKPFLEPRLAALRQSLGQFPPAPKDLKLRVTGTQEGDGFRVDNLVYESRPGLLVSANLYRPARPAKSMPGIVIVLSHQQPRQIGQRQDMAMTWARAGCLVLVPDHLGHGERGQHPFRSEKDHARAFPVGRQDYYHRYDNAMLLDLVGDSLMGWFVWDLMRGIDVLLAQPGIDPERIVLISEPAGGGDVAAVTAALDPRIAGALINNFGGPEPESTYPLPRDAEQSFEYSGSGSWESTRNLRLSCRDGFLPWVILAGMAPRRLIYYHEFYWDRDHDPVWKRLQKVHGWHDAADRLTGAAGYGFVVGSPPENSHWIPRSRELLYPLLERWFKIADPKTEYSQRLPEDKLLGLTPDLKPTPLHELAGRLGADRAAAARKERAALSPADQKTQLRRQWTGLLGNVDLQADPVVRMLEKDDQQLPGVSVERIHLTSEPGIVLPVLLLVPTKSDTKDRPVVVAVAQAGKQEFLKQRSKEIAELLKDGIAVCLVDVRGTGETSPGGGRDRGAPITSISSSQLMLGQPLLGGRLRDLRSVLRLLRQRKDTGTIALWGDSFTPPNPADVSPLVPHGIDRPPVAEPLGGLLALLAGLFEDDIRAIYVHGGLSSYQSALQGPFVYLPHDVVIPSVLTTGDLNDLATILGPRPVRLDGMVDALNHAVAPDALAKIYASNHIVLQAKDSPARWLASQLKKR